MPVPDSINATSDNKPLKDFLELKRRYGGPLSMEHVAHVRRELADIVPNGRYTGRDGEGPVCVLARDLDGLLNGFDRVFVVFVPVNKKGEQRKGVEEFLGTFRFFAPDCA